MKRTLTVVMAMAILGSVVGTGLAAEVKGFYKTFAEAQKQARKQDKPMYLHFTTKWCGWCRRIEKDIYKKPAGKKALAGFVCATLDCTVPKGKRPSGQKLVNIKLMQKYGGGGYPFLVMLGPDGTLLNKFAGYKPMPEFTKELAKAEKIMATSRQMKECRQKGKTDSPEYQELCLKYYTTTGQWPKAAAAAKALRKLDPKASAGLINYAILKGALASNAEEKKILRLREELRKADPQNKDGYLEKMLWGQVAEIFQKTNPKNKDSQKQALEKVEVVLVELTGKVPNLSSEMELQANWVLGRIQAELGRVDDSIATLEKLLAKYPKSPQAERIKKVIEMLKAQKSGAGRRGESGAARNGKPGVARNGKP